MPIEYARLSGEPHRFAKCKHCGEPYPEFMRGQVQSAWRRFFGMPYCAVICHHCKKLTGWEKP